MTELIHKQLFEMFIMFYCGMAMMLIFEVRNRWMGLFGEKSRVSIFLYLGSWLCAAFLFSQFLYRGTYGVISVHVVISAISGIVLWKKVIYGIIDAGNIYEKKENKGATSGISARRISRRTARKNKKKENCKSK